MVSIPDEKKGDILAELSVSGIIGFLKKGYFYVEDKYYSVLDKLNDKVPVYAVVDQIDKVVPSFVFFALLLVGIIAVAIIGGPAFFQTPAQTQFAVVDSDGLGVPFASFFATKDEQDFSGLADEQGNFFLPADGNIYLKITKEGFDSFEGMIEVTAGELKKIVMEKERPLLREKTILVYDSLSKEFVRDGTVSVSFSCPASIKPVSIASLSGQGHEIKVMQPADCPELKATIEAAEYYPKSNSLTSATTKFYLNRAGAVANEKKGTILVKVSDEKGIALQGIQLLLAGTGNKSQTKFSSQGYTEFIAGFGEYALTAMDLDGKFISQTKQVQLTSVGEQKIVFALQSIPEEDGWKIFAKFVDRETGQALQGVTADIYANTVKFAEIIDGQIISPKITSDIQGLVELKGIDGNKAFGLVAFKQGYVIQPVKNLQRMKAGNKVPQEIKLIKVQEDEQGNPTNYGNASVTIIDDQNQPIQGATATLFNESFRGFSFGANKTNQSGQSEIKYLPIVGSYYARGDTSFGTGESPRKGLNLGTTEFQVKLVKGKASLQGKTFELYSIAPVADAKIEFFSYPRETFLFSFISKADGTTDSNTVKVNALPYATASKPGYLKTVTPFTAIQRNEVAEFDLPMAKEDLLENEIELNFIKVMDEFGGEASTIEAGEEYTAVFYLAANNSLDDVKANFRAGKNETLFSDLNIVLIGGENNPFSQEIKSTEIDSGDFYSNPIPTNDDAKQSNLYFRNQEKTLTVIEIKFRTKDELADGTNLEMHFMAKGTGNGENVSVDEKVAVFVVGNPLFCDPNSSSCVKFVYSFQIFDFEGNEIKKELGKFKLTENMEYDFGYRIFNQTNQAYNNVSADFADSAGTFNFSSKREPIGTLGPRSQASGSFKIVPTLPGIGEISLDLGVDSEDNQCTAMFDISSQEELQLRFSPNFILPFSSNNLFVYALDSQNRPVKNALIKVNEDNMQFDSPSIGTFRTNSNGFALVQVEYPYSGRLVYFMGSRQGFIDSIEFKEAQAIVPSTEAEEIFGCIEVSPKDGVELSTPNSPKNFSVANNCLESVDVSLVPQTSVSFDLSERIFSLQPGNSKVLSINSAQYPGYYEIKVLLKRTERDEDYLYFADLPVSVRSPPSSCFELSKGIFEIKRNLDSGKIIKKDSQECTAYQRSNDYPSVSTPNPNVFLKMIPKFSNFRQASTFVFFNSDGVDHYSTQDKAWINHYILADNSSLEFAPAVYYNAGEATADAVHVNSIDVYTKVQGTEAGHAIEFGLPGKDFKRIAGNPQYNYVPAGTGGQNDLKYVDAPGIEEVSDTGFFRTREHLFWGRIKVAVWSGVANICSRYLWNCTDSFAPRPYTPPVPFKPYYVNSKANIFKVTGKSNPENKTLLYKAKIDFLDEDADQGNEIDFNVFDRSLVQSAFDVIEVKDFVQGTGPEIASQRFHVKFKAREKDVCYGRIGVEGKTGQEAVPKILLSWTWDDFDEHTCTADSGKVNYCDAVQFSIMLMKRMNKINELIKQGNFDQTTELRTFKAFLMEDGYSLDLQEDFDSYYKSNYLSEGTPQYYINELSALFKDTAAFVFTDPTNPAEIRKNVVPVNGPGLYSVNIEINIIDEGAGNLVVGGEPNANVKVYLSKEREPVTGSPFYSLALDGKIGFENGVYDRQGYGKVLHGENFAVDDSFEFEPMQVQENSVKVSTDQSLESMNKSLRGDVFVLTDKEMTLLYSDASPVAMFLEDADYLASQFYYIQKLGESIVSLNEFGNYWSGFASTIGKDVCVDFNNNYLFFEKEDSPRSSESVSCELNSNALTEQEKVYGFTFKPTTESKQHDKVGYRTVFYTPQNENFDLLAGCETPMLSEGIPSFVDAKGTGIDSSGDRIELNYTAMLFAAQSQKLNSLKRMFELIEEEYLCVNEESNQAEVWWNEETLYNNLERMYPNTTDYPSLESMNFDCLTIKDYPVNSRPNPEILCDSRLYLPENSLCDCHEECRSSYCSGAGVCEAIPEFYELYEGTKNKEFGITAYLAMETKEAEWPSLLPNELDELMVRTAEEAGEGTVRDTLLNWDISLNETGLDLTDLSSLIEKYNDFDLNIIALVGPNPCTATEETGLCEHTDFSADDSRFKKPLDEKIEDWQEFLELFAESFDDDGTDDLIDLDYPIQLYEYKSYYSSLDDLDFGREFLLLKAFKEAITNANPEAKIVLGGVKAVDLVLEPEAETYFTKMIGMHLEDESEPLFDLVSVEYDSSDAGLSNAVAMDLMAERIQKEFDDYKTAMDEKGQGFEKEIELILVLSTESDGSEEGKKVQAETLAKLMVNSVAEIKGKKNYSMAVAGDLFSKETSTLVPSPKTNTGLVEESENTVAKIDAYDSFLTTASRLSGKELQKVEQGMYKFKQEMFEYFVWKEPGIDLVFPEELPALVKVTDLDGRTRIMPNSALEISSPVFISEYAS